MWRKLQHCNSTGKFCALIPARALISDANHAAERERRGSRRKSDTAECGGMRAWTPVRQKINKKKKKRKTVQKEACMIKKQNVKEGKTDRNKKIYRERDTDTAVGGESARRSTSLFQTPETSHLLTEPHDLIHFGFILKQLP